MRSLGGGGAVAKVIESRPASFRTVLSRIIIIMATARAPLRSLYFRSFRKEGKSDLLTPAARSQLARHSGGPLIGLLDRDRG